MAAMPTRLRLQWRGGLGPDFDANLVDGILTVQSHLERVAIRPSARDWEELLTLVQETGASHWDVRYESDRLLLDCISWSVEIDAPGTSVRSGGYDSFPPGDGLDRLLDFVAGLAGVSRTQ
jgi:hypothetical protein